VVRTCRLFSAAAARGYRITTAIVAGVALKNVASGMDSSVFGGNGITAAGYDQTVVGGPKEYKTMIIKNQDGP
jgi:hypothetical protein